MTRRFLGRSLALTGICLAFAASACKKSVPVDPGPPPKPPSIKGFRVDCKGKTQRISPLIYGVGFDITGYSDWKEPRQWDMRPTARRLGGNAASRYNWDLGTAFNHGLDWHFENNGDASAKEPFYVSFLRGNAEHHAASALQIPLLGWVAKDVTSASFPITQFPGQKTIDEKRSAGTGVMISGREIAPPPPTQTSIAATPGMVATWITKSRAEAAKAGEVPPRIYMLDNESGLWNSTHRDVHPEPATYDELLDRTVRYASAVRGADKDGLIAGPNSFGWSELLYSARDVAMGIGKKPDRLAHGDVPLLPWYLKKLKEHEDKTTVRLLDIVDVHFYPQGEGMGVGVKGDIDNDAAARRIRSTRALWDPSYVDESWIHEPVRLLPRLHEWVDQNYPGRRIEIGEWNFGAERHMSSGLATAEALGRFAQGEVFSAFYWPYPALDSAAYWAFRAFRNFDGKGGAFQDTLVPSEAEEGTSLWVSRDESGKHLVLVALNFDPKKEVSAPIDIGSCGEIDKETRYVYAGTGGLAEKPDNATGHVIAGALPPYSISVYDVRLK
ncbi:MAG: hypothetical protein HOO96_41220 [Polyangiaceae bacterium]|nr:hypothetical protein [Polyangiaceae bacterium]